MPFMLLILVAIIVVAVMAFLNTSPPVARRGPLVAFNAITLALSVPAAAAVGAWIYVDALAKKPAEVGMAVYLGIMAGGTAALLVVAVFGLVRNFVVYPRSRRIQGPRGGAS